MLGRLKITNAMVNLLYFLKMEVYTKEKWLIIKGKVEALISI